MNWHSSTEFKKEIRLSMLLFGTHHLWNSTTELILFPTKFYVISGRKIRSWIMKIPKPSITFRTLPVYWKRWFFSLNFKGMWRKSLSQYVVQKYNSILQPSLNCEELDAKLGLELRWTMSQDDIILQLVSNTGNDRYLALGIRDPTESKGIAGK